MKKIKKNNYLFNWIKILFIIFIFNFCRTFEGCDNHCLKIILYKNGTIQKNCTDNLDNESDDVPNSITFDDKIIIFECEKKDKVTCIYNPKEENQNLTCSELNTTNKDNYACCKLKEYNKETDSKNYSCIEIYKSDFGRFKGLGDKQFEDNLNIDDREKRKDLSVLICFSNLYKINIFLIFLFLLIFLNI